MFFENDVYNWLSLAGIFIIIEVTTFSLLFLSLAIAAFFMAAIKFVLPQITGLTEITLFSALCIVATIVWFLYLRKGQKKLGLTSLNNRADRYIGQAFVVSEPIVAGHGKIKVGDSHWIVNATTQTNIKLGAKVKVIATKGAVLIVEELSENE